MWIKIQGGWENDETVEEAALREAMEEAGVDGKMGVSWNLSLFDIMNVTIIMKYDSTASATTREDELGFMKLAILFYLMECILRFSTTVEVTCYWILTNCFIMIAGHMQNFFGT